MGRPLLTVLGLLVLAGCATSESSPPAQDCAVAVRHQGTVYVEAGLTTQRGARLGTADVSSCDDMGEDAKGTYFSDEPDHVTVWSFRGQDPGRVLGVRAPGGVRRVLVAENLTKPERRALELSGLMDTGRQ